MRRALLFSVTSSASYLLIATVFAIFCMAAGHNTMEMIYGGAATIVLPLVTGIEVAWLWNDRS